MPKINILYTSHTYEMCQGGQISLYELIRRLDPNKYQPFLICPSSGSLSQNFEKIGCQILFFKFPRITVTNVFKVPICILKFLIFLRNKHIQIIHSDHPTDTFYLAICARILQLPLIWHARVSFGSRLDHLNVFLATKVISVSDSVSHRFSIRNKISPKVVTIHNGVDYHHFKPNGGNRTRKALGLAKSEKIITTIGQITPEKGMDEFLTSAELILEKAAHCQFLMVGMVNDFYLKAITDRIAVRDLQDHVHYLGFRNDVNRILNATDIFVLASYVEGLPRVVLEAMSCGKPVVGTRVQGINEAVKEETTGLLVPPRDPENLAKAILNLIEDDKKAKKMGTAGRERVKRYFSIESNVSKIEHLYQETLNKFR